MIRRKILFDGVLKINYENSRILTTEKEKIGTRK
jgi:hypothetical protein